MEATGHGGIHEAAAAALKANHCKTDHLATHVADFRLDLDLIPNPSRKPLIVTLTLLKADAGAFNSQAESWTERYAMSTRQLY